MDMFLSTPQARIYQGQIPFQSIASNEQCNLTPSLPFLSQEIRDLVLFLKIGWWKVCNVVYRKLGMSFKTTIKEFKQSHRQNIKEMLLLIKSNNVIIKANKYFH